MALVNTSKATNALKYWYLSLAWKNIGNYAKGLTVGDAIDTARTLCCDQGRLGDRADDLLHDIVHDKERTPLEVSAKVYNLAHYIMEPRKLGLQA